MKTRKCAKRGKSRKRGTKYGKKYGQTKKHGQRGGFHIYLRGKRKINVEDFNRLMRNYLRDYIEYKKYMVSKKAVRVNPNNSQYLYYKFDMGKEMYDTLITRLEDLRVRYGVKDSHPIIID